jgi:hypothetical protein
MLFLSCRLNRHQFGVKQSGLPLEFLLKPLLSVFVPRGSDTVVVFDLFGNESVEDDGDLVCGALLRLPQLPPFDNAQAGR